MFPAAYNMIARWVPVAERTRAVALVMSGLSLGTLFALPATAAIVRNYGWPAAFYIFGMIGVAWAIAWFAGVPGGRGIPVAPLEVGSPAKPTIPWGKIVATPAVWAITLNHFCHNWTLYLFVAWLPSYFRATHGLNLTSAGLYSAAPWLTMFIMTNVAGWLADRMIRRGVSVTFVRKLMQSIGLLGSAACLVLVRDAVSAITALILLSVAAGSLAFAGSGFAANGFDIAPRYAEVIFGISNTFATLPGVVGVALTGWLVDATGTYAAPFLVTASLNLLGAIVFLVFATGRQLID
jgi:ACS family sodium-dependent inorganic phosphate cotransporter